MTDLEQAMPKRTNTDSAPTTGSNAFAHDSSELLLVDDAHSVGSHAYNGGDQEEAKEMTNKQDSRIRTFRFMLAGMLLMTAAVTVVAYVFLMGQENENFETAYGQFARTLADAARNHQKSLRSSLKSLANEVTGYGQTNNLTWPYVVLPHFESYATGFFEKSHAEFVGINNLVMDDQREDFVNYSAQHHVEWIKDSHMIRYGNMDLLDQNKSKYNEYISKKAKDGFPEDEQRPYYSVRTSQSPPMRAYGPMLNLNIASIGDNGALIDAVMELRNETLVTALKPFDALPAEEHKNFHTDSSADNPHSFMYVAMYERVQDPSSTIVGTITSSVAWDASMQHLLPETVHGILCVVKNNCNQSFTYHVDGPGAFYLGKGDLHDTQYDNMEVAVDLSEHSHPNFTTTPGHCQYSMHIYPTNEFKDDYTTAIPLTFALTVACSFALVALVFFVYDGYVQKRNRELAVSAARSNKLVSTLFPGDIKDRILEQQDASDMKMTRDKNASAEPSNDEDGDQNETTFTALANEYPSVTIFLADLVGFTQWSSKRTPQQVFELLETIYVAFDAIARKRSVFKVETIGDCYVAATGIPNAQRDHPIRMVRFANECLLEMSQIVHGDLTTSLGPDTKDLRLRVGLHSGSVFGGVLRGDKKRFQLYGDTINTASRMESNGLPGRIQVSQATADLIIAAGRQRWLTPRKDKIVAKGKGELQTYFVNVTSAGTASVSGESHHGGSIVSGDSAVSDEPDENAGGRVDSFDC